MSLSLDQGSTKSHGGGEQYGQQVSRIETEDTTEYFLTMSLVHSQRVFSNYHSYDRLKTD